MIHKWKRLHSSKLFTHPRLTVYEDDVELPGGLRTKYLHFGDMPDSAMIVARRKDGKILVQKEYSYPPNEVLFQLPGGAINRDEKPEEGATREFAEEAGYTGELSLIGWFYVHNRRSKSKMYIYLATDLVEVAKSPDPEEALEDYWFSESEIDEMIRTNEIRNHTLLAGWAIYKTK